MADVFISYHRSEGTSALVRRIAAELENMGISCWYDTKDPNPGYFVQTIEQQILCCKVFLLIWDEGANNSEWCLTETYIAFEGANRPIRIPFQIGTFTKDNDMKFYMKRCQIFSGGNSPEDSDIQALIHGIAGISGNLPAKIIYDGFCGSKRSNVKYTLDEKGVLTIFGTGAMKDYSYANNTKSPYIFWRPKTFPPPWINDRTMISHVHINDGVTSIGTSSFYGCTNLKYIKIPESVKYIKDHAFYSCLNLPSVVIPNSVTRIGNSAFQYCMNLASIQMPDHWIHIGSMAFQGCKELKTSAFHL